MSYPLLSIQKRSFIFYTFLLFFAMSVGPLWANEPPVVYAGSDVSINPPEVSVELNGAASDDGLPNPELSLTWSVESGPGPVLFDNATQAVTQATFSLNGIYVLRLTANDGELEQYDELIVEFQDYAAAQPATPAGLEAVAGASSVNLAWMPNSENDLLGYNVYRDTDATGEFGTQLNADLVTVPSYEDWDVALGTTYYYKITAVNTSGMESEKTGAVSAVVGAISVTMPDYRGDPGTAVALSLQCAYASGIVGNGMDIDVTYDPAILTPVRVQRTVITNSFSFFDNISIASGHVKISGISTDGATIVGDGRLVDIIFSVAANAAPGATALHTFAKVKMYDAQVRALAVDYTDTATFTVSESYIRGDVNGDGSIDSADALLAQQASANLITLSPVQQAAADVSGNGSVDAADVTLILRLAVGLPIDPPDSGKPQSAPKIVPAIQVSLPAVTGDSGKTVTVPVNVSERGAIAGAVLQVNFDSAILTPQNVVAGQSLPQSALKWKPLPGAVLISFSNATALPGGPGKLVDIQFKVQGAPRSQTLLTLSQAKLTGAFGQDLDWTTTIKLARGLFTVKPPASGAGAGWKGYP